MHVTARTIRMWVNKGRLRAFRTDMGRGGRMLISRAEVRKMLTMVYNKPAD
jgi:excisionase family DNA binding protein